MDKILMSRKKIAENYAYVYELKVADVQTKAPSLSWLSHNV